MDYLVDSGKAYTATDEKIMIETLKSALYALKKNHYINFATPCHQTVDKYIDFESIISSQFSPGEDIKYDMPYIPSRASYVKRCYDEIFVPQQLIEKVKVDPTHELNTSLIDLLVCKHNAAFLAAFESSVEDGYGKIVSGVGVYDDFPGNRSSRYLGDKTQTLDQNYINKLFEDKLADFQNDSTVIICNPNILQLLQSLIFRNDVSKKTKTLFADKLVKDGEFYVAVKSAMKYAYFTEILQFFLFNCPTKDIVFETLLSINLDLEETTNKVS